MSAYTTTVTHATGDVLPATDWNTYIRDNFAFLHDQGADLSGATITPTSQFHRVTGTTTITSIAAPSGTGQGGNRLTLKFQSAGCAITAGAALILTGGVFNSAANQSISFIWDSTLAGWIETGRTSVAGMTLIADTTLGGDAASIDFQNIPATYAHLMLVCYARTSIATANDALYVRFNNDSGANYYYSEINALASATSAFSNRALTAAFMCDAAGNTADALKFGGGVIFIPHYAGTTNHKVALGLSGSAPAAASITNSRVSAIHAQWASAAAISRITLADSSFAALTKAGSRVGLYGIGV